jgi:Response regulators consisting of a CheY-like receiver domain and a winged-helix DNA-binding domain
VRILLAEDNKTLADWLEKALRHGGFAVDSIHDGADADHLLLTQVYDLVILDLGLPRMDGFEVLRRLRRRGCSSPVLILTARGAVESRVEGLNLGADDYLSKPFSLSELEARINAVIRRARGAASPVQKVGELEYDSLARTFRLRGAILALRPKEHAVLEILMARAGKAVPRLRCTSTCSTSASRRARRRSRSTSTACASTCRAREWASSRCAGSAMSSNAKPPSSLRRQLLAWILGPLLFLFAVNALLSYRVAIATANQAYDRLLLASVKAIADRVTISGGEISVDIPYVALELFESNIRERIFYKVSGPVGATLTGYDDLPAPPATATPDRPNFFRSEYHGESLYQAALFKQLYDPTVKGMVLIQVGETAESREALSRRILYDGLVRQGLLIGFAALLLSLGARYALKPLLRLRDSIAQRTSTDLTPVDESGVQSEVRRSSRRSTSIPSASTA